jgi:outer membrane protein assembly factor BamA
MLCSAVRTAAILLLIGATTGAAQPAQAPDTERPEKPPTLLERVKEPDQGGGFHLTKHFAIVTGGIKSGSGVALGPALSTKFDNGAYFQVKALYSIRRFRLLQARYDTQPFWNGRALLSSRVRWQDAPKLDLYALGPESPDVKARYAEQKSDVSTRLGYQLAPSVRLGTGFGIERYTSSAGSLDLVGDPAVPPQQIMPGLGTRPWYAHSFFGTALDTRTSPDYSRSGRLIEGVFHSFNDLHDGQDPFGRFDGAVQQLVPTHGGKGVIALSANTWLSLAGGARSVPFFLMPTLGGSSHLLGYKSYRFRDRHALALKGEYRWAVHKSVDVAGMYEIG